MEKKKQGLAIPYIAWTVIFSIVPLIIILVYSFCERTPYGDIVFKFTTENYVKFFQPIYLKVLWRSVVLAVSSTLACLLIGYPMAWIIARAGDRARNFMVMLFVLPLWTNFLLRTYAWMGLLRENGFFNQLLMAIGLIHQPLKMLYTDGAVMVGMVYNFLPFMVLPIYSVLVKMDQGHIDAANDLGADPKQTFLRVILPLSFPGIVSGIIMVFMPALSTFIISDLLGGGQTMMLGNLIQNQFLSARNWQFGSAISSVMIVMVLITTLISGKYRGEGSEMLW
ncbi:MAG TPA: ABC transporter permease [Bacillota bacterium]|nr:ABC transporter permease [Bacillota bacterium]HOH09734.1 ABC transporter permease [Bacillota bacterium]HOS50202.1 ABC transporter permease [Bacillota bacterium]HOY88468.1 ABC transporter permease [Bacillota bacterium]HPI00621.1 ABC transporter permease [Bacillota bacterium]